MTKTMIQYVDLVDGFPSTLMVRFSNGDWAFWSLEDLEEALQMSDWSVILENRLNEWEDAHQAR